MRVRVLAEFDRAPVYSPIEFQRRRIAPVGDVEYHIKVLEKYGCLRLIDIQSRRGSFEHFYELTDRGRFIVSVIREL
jgi:hypothetical protein